MVEWVSLGAIPAAVPHTRDVPILGTTSEEGRLRGDIQPGPAGLLRVPAAAISVLEMAVAEGGIPAVGYFAQVPHYVSGPYPAASVALVEALGRHLGLSLPTGGAFMLICAADDGNSAWTVAKHRMVAAAQARLARSKVVWFHNTAHDIHVHRPEELAALLLQERNAGIWSAGDAPAKGVQAHADA